MRLLHQLILNDAISLRQRREDDFAFFHGVYSGLGDLIMVTG